jgi:acyl-CoA thioester hydrolase
MKKWDFRLDFQVRDYECDMQGVVNNAVYQNYLEHARHEYLKTLGLDFAEFTRQGINLVVVRAELDYRKSLRSGDSFCVELCVERVSPVRFAFVQQIRRLSDDALILSARIVGTALNRGGRPKLPPQIVAALGAPCGQ